MVESDEPPIALVFIAGRFVLGVTGWEALGVEIAQGNPIAFAFSIYDSRFTIYRFLVLPRAVSRVGRCCHPLERNSFCFDGTCQSDVSRNHSMFPLPMGEG
jgi:hypothetical protein